MPVHSRTSLEHRGTRALQIQRSTYGSALPGRGVDTGEGRVASVRIEKPAFGSGRVWRRRQVLGVAALAGVVAAVSQGAPTGLTLWDGVLKFALVFATVLAVSYAPRWVAIVFATAAASFVGFSLWLIVAVAGMAVAIAAAIRGSRNRVVSALSAGLAMQALFRLPSFGFFGLPSLLVGALILLPWFFGYRTARPNTRRNVRRWSAATLAVLSVGLLAGTFALLGARTEADRGVSAARTGLQAVRDGDTDRVLIELDIAEEALAGAHDQLGSIWAQPLRLIPVVAQNHRAVSVAASEGSAVARLAAMTTREADISTIRASNGSVNVAALADMAPALRSTASRLDEAALAIRAADSSWLVGAVDRRLKGFVDELEAVLPEANLAAEAAEVVPDLLGVAEPRRYLIAFGTPAESRELGGLFGSWALVDVTDGSLSPVESGRISEFYDVARSSVALDESQYPAWFIATDPTTYPQNLTSSPNIDLVAAATRQVLSGLPGPAIDGLIYVDPYTIEAMLELSGPVEIAALDTTLSSDTAQQIFFDEQYRIDATRDETFEIFAPALQAVLDRLLAKDLPGPERLGAVFGPVARQGRLQMATFDERENQFLDSVFLHRNFGWSPPPDRGTSDGFAIIQTTGSEGKLDLYLRREVTYDVAVSESGELTGQVSIRLTSTIPSDAPEYALAATGGLNKVLLSLYTPHLATSVRLNGEEVRAAVTEEFGYFRHLVPVDVGANTSQLVEFEITGLVDMSAPYDLAIWQQPLVHDDLVHIVHTGPDGNRTASNFDLVENSVFSAEE